VETNGERLVAVKWGESKREDARTVSVDEGTEGRAKRGWAAAALDERGVTEERLGASSHSIEGS
jgi:hypothetical protein